jgi:hypothetical protein
MVAPSSPSPSLGVVTGEVVGSHFYVYSQPPLGSGNPGTLWRWRPALTAGPGGAANGGAYNSATANGHTAGIVIGILTGLANLYCLVALVGNAGINLVPEWAERIPLVGPWLSGAGGGGFPRGGPSGFYSANGGGGPGAAAGVGAAGGGYVAPPDL